MILDQPLLRPLADLRTGVRWRYLGAYLLALVPALVIAFAQPVWSRVDEAQHTDVVVQYAHGVYPIEGRTKIRPETLALMQETGIYRWSLPGAAPLPGQRDPNTFGAPPSTQPGSSEFRAWVRRHLWGYSYEAMQPPLFYCLATPVWIAGNAAGGALGGVYAVRILNALLLALLGPITFAIARLALPGVPRLALLSVTGLAVLPGLVLNGSQVGNDTLVAVLGGAAVLIAVRGAVQGWRPRLAVLLGLAFGGALLTKPTAAGLAPALALAFLWPAGTPGGERLRAALLAAGVGLAVLAPWLLVNEAIYGQPVPGRATRLLLGQVFAAPSLSLSYLARSAKNAFATFLTGEPYNTMVLVRPLGYIGAAWAVLAVVGSARLLRRAGWPPALLLLLAAVAGQAAWLAVQPYLSQVGGLMPGRYLYPAAAPALVLLVAGAWEFRRLRVAVLGAYLALAVVALAAFSAGITGSQPDPRSQPPPGAVAVSAENSFAGLHLLADRVVLADGGRLAWVHLTVRDESSQPVDWNPSGSGLLGDGTAVRAVYSASSPFPERLQPGAEATGWMEFRFDRVPPQKPETLKLVFSDVAPADYSTVLPSLPLWIDLRAV